MALRLGKIRINRLWVLVVSAVLLGILATWLSVTYLRHREEAIQTQLVEKAKGGAKMTVIVPTADLPKGTVIDQGVVAGRDIAVDLVYKDTLLVDDFDAIQGLKLLRPVQKGRPLMREDVIDDSPKQFAEAITKGMRAITIDIDDLNSISQMLKPGNFIDLNLIAPEPGIAGSQQALLFLQHVKVLATGSITDANVQTRDQNADPMAQAVQQFSTVTVEVTPEEAAYVALAQQSGKIRATLRAIDDQEIAAYPPVNSARLVGFGKKAETGTKGVATVDRKVEYIVGGKGGGGAAPPININVPGLNVPGVPAAVPAPSGNVSMPGLPAAVTPAVNNAVNQANPAVYAPR